MVTQVLCWMWCIVFSILMGSWTVFGYTAIAHLVFVAAIFVTVASFETAKRNPKFFKGQDYEKLMGKYDDIW